MEVHTLIQIKTGLRRTSGEQEKGLSREPYSYCISFFFNNAFTSLI